MLHATRMSDVPPNKPDHTEDARRGAHRGAHGDAHRDAPHGTSGTAFLPAFLAAITRPPAASRGRFILAMCVALAADLLFWWLGEALPVVADFVVAFILALCLGGFSVELLGAFIAEATPGIGLVPCWSIAVPILWARANTARKSADAARGTTAPPRGS